MLKPFIILNLLFLTTITQSYPMTTITKSPNDNREYQSTLLDNGIKLLVISDPNTPRSAAAVDLTVGSSSDPDDFLGLAHFLEHMLFLGTDQFPEPDDYINFINNHGGSHNAYTSFNNTNYFFDIDPNFLHDGLKRFSRFFVAPLLNEKYVERERNAVDSEFQSKLKEDGWRNLEVLKSVVNPKHPYSRFTIGNNHTLPKKTENRTIRQALVTFYEAFYTPDRMSVVILGREDTKTLINWGKNLFSHVPQRTHTDNNIDKKLFAKDSLPIHLSSQSIKNEHTLSLYYHFDYDQTLDYHKMLNYISHILGYEGKGSLLALLKQLNFATGLYAGAGYRIGNEVNFEMSIDLTDSGYKNYQEVLAIVFQYIDKLKQDTNGESRYLEIAQIAQNQFTYQEKYPAIRVVSDYAVRMNRYPIKDILAVQSIYSGYDSQKLNSFINKMTPKNVVTLLSSPKEKGEQNSKFFSVPYTKLQSKLATISLSDTAKAALEQAHLPNKNPFLANDYKLKPQDASCQQQLQKNQVHLYHCQDTGFGVPKSVVILSLQPDANLSVADKVKLNLISRVAAEQLEQTTYDAAIAGLSVELIAGEKSITLSLEGYQQKINDLLSIVLKTLNQIDINIDKNIFDRVKDSYQKELINAGKESPYGQTFAYLNKSLLEDASLAQEKLDVIDSISSKDLSLFAQQAFKQISTKLFVYGNNTFNEAKLMANLVANTLDKSTINNNWKNNRAKTIDTAKHITFNPNHEDSAITYYLPAGEGYNARAVVGLLAKIIEPKFFNDLRTEKQLGYVVFAYPRPVYNHAGLAFTVQSPIANAEALENHIKTFNQLMIKEIDHLDQKTFNDLKQILIAEITQKPEKLSTAASYIWSDILKTGKMESSRHAVAKAVEKLNLQESIEQFKSVLSQPISISIKTTTKK